METNYLDMLPHFSYLLNKTIKNKGKDYNARSVRRYYANEHVKLVVECEILDMPLPHNPLQHKSLKMTIDRYAIQGADDRNEAI